ncbi:MAG TPA: hypothetical protein VNO86_11285, partial [Candidatus Binatia bacterium]|nr:hypothetical protein [Candidatus Binatia bacterium]
PVLAEPVAAAPATPPPAAPSELAAASPSRPAFAHASEAELARILDFYAVRWEYEPRVFPILWSLDGTVLESFTPDFYLPDFDLYLELTTLRQRLVRKKNRKLRRLRELYPDIRIKLFYARDFRALMLKYGRLAVAEELSGALGQVVPDRRPEAASRSAEGRQATGESPDQRAEGSGRGSEAPAAAAPARRSAAATAARSTDGGGVVGGVVGGVEGRRPSRSRRTRRRLAPAGVDSEP